MLVFGHRGASGYVPENTLLSVRMAVDLGADFVEVDVHCADDELIVIHDEQLERTTNGSGRIADHSLDELRRLDAGDGERIPLLGEVFDEIGGATGINVELKGPRTAEPVAKFIAERVANGWPLDRLLVSSFDHRMLEIFRAARPDVPLGALISEPAKDASFAAELGATSVHPALDFVDRRFVDDAHERGLAVYVYTVNEPSDIARMRALGVDGVFSDFPDRVIDGQSRM